jgi:hypothetical protein
VSVFISPVSHDSTLWLLHNREVDKAIAEVHAQTERSIGLYYFLSTFL